VRALRPDVPRELADLVAWLMAREPEARPASAAAVLAAVAALPRPAPPAARPRPRPRPQPAAFFTGLAAALVLGRGIGAVGRWAQPPGARVAPQAIDTPPPAAAASPAPAWHLDAALAAAADGATITVPDGTHAVAPVQVRGKRLTLRAAADTRPVLLRL